MIFIFSIVCFFFFFKQKTAYEMRISDWSSDVCSSDLRRLTPDARDVDRLLGAVIARRIGAETREAVDVRRDEADVGGAALPGIERGHFGQPHVTVEGVEPGQQRDVAGGWSHCGSTAGGSGMGRKEEQQGGKGMDKAGRY